MKIKPKLFIIILTLVLLSLLIASAISINAFSHAMTAEIKKRLEDNTILSMKQISSITAQKVSDAQMISLFIGRLFLSNQSGIADQGIFQDTLRNIIAREQNETSPSFTSLAVYNKSGVKIVHQIIGGNKDKNNLELSLGHNASRDHFFNTAIKGWSFHDNVPWHTSFMNESIIRVSAPITDDREDIEGVLALTYPLAEIFRHITGVNSNANGLDESEDGIKKNMETYLLSQNGTRIYYSNIPDTREESEGSKNSRSPLIFQDIKNSNDIVVSGIYPVNVVDNTGGGERDAIFVATKGGIGNSDNNSAIPNTTFASTGSNSQYGNNSENNWFLITSLGTESAFEEMSNLKNTFILVTLLVLAGTAVAVFYFSKFISKPITTLKDAAISIAHGNLNEQFKPFSSRDEIGELSIHFERMRDSIRIYTDELTRKEKELELYNKELVANDKAKEEFISMVSHELRTPLVPIKLYSEMLLKPEILGELNNKQKKAVEIIHKSMLKQEQLVEDVLDVFKLDMNKLSLSKKDIEIYALVNELVNDLKSFTIEKQIDLTFDIRTRSIKTVFCDKRRIEQVFANLIKNSIDFVPEKSGKINIKAEEVQDATAGSSVDYENRSQFAMFSIEDNGIGISHENAAKLFKKFYQIDTSATRRHGGSGLGLAICKGIVEAHEGKIWIDKEYTGGTAVRFTIPSTR
jgi:signal transduction histidine kinase